METKTNEEEILKIKKNMVREIKHGFDGLISRLSIVEAKSMTLKKYQLQFPKLESKEEKKEWREKKKPRITNNCGAITKPVTHTVVIPEVRKELKEYLKKCRRIFQNQCYTPNHS